jgi:hypothetical protein
MTFRKCYDCGQRIEACFGFAFATDWLLALYGIIPWSLCRERCGVCVERHASIGV